MPVTTTVTSADIATALGRPAPSSPTSDQWSMWIDEAVFLIQKRVTALEHTEELDQDTVDYVVRHAVVAQVRRPDDATQVSVTVDDGTTSKLYRTSAGRVTILDEWWDLLGLAGESSSGRAFEVDTMPESAGVLGVDYWWSTPTDITTL